MCEWSPNRYGRCGECGSLGEPDGNADVWHDEPDRKAVGSERTTYRQEHWTCVCGCAWWEQFRWRGQTKERQ